MAQRTLDQSYIEMLRDIQERLKKLESSQNNSVKRNDIRLSDTIVTADSENDRLCLENLISGVRVCIGEQEEGFVPQAMWSFSGDLTTADSDSYSAPYLSEKKTIACQIIIAQGCGDSFDSDNEVTVCVEFCGGIQSRIVLGGTDQMVVKEINVPIEINDSVRVHLISAPESGASNISVFVRFGLPTVGLSEGDCVL